MRDTDAVVHILDLLRMSNEYFYNLLEIEGRKARLGGALHF